MNYEGIMTPTEMAWIQLMKEEINTHREDVDVASNGFNPKSLSKGIITTPPPIPKPVYTPAITPILIVLVMLSWMILVCYIM